MQYSSRHSCACELTNELLDSSCVPKEKLLPCMVMAPKCTNWHFGYFSLEKKKKSTTQIDMQEMKYRTLLFFFFCKYIVLRLDLKEVVVQCGLPQADQRLVSMVTLMIPIANTRLTSSSVSYIHYVNSKSMGSSPILRLKIGSDFNQSPQTDDNQYISRNNRLITTGRT